MTALETFAPLPRRVRIATREVEVLPLTLGRLVAAAEAARPIGAWLTMGDYAVILEEHPAAARAVLVCAVGLTEAEADALDLAQAVELLSAHYEVNADFFARRLAPVMRQARAGARAALEQLTATVTGTATTGEKPSPGSASADTPSPTVSA